jgi:hypothetical protein
MMYSKVSEEYIGEEVLDCAKKRIGITGINMRRDVVA